MQVNIGAAGIQVNVFAAEATLAPLSTLGEFRTDVLALLTGIDARARRWGLPIYFGQDADVLSMARQVRLLGRVRRGEETHGTADRDRVYRSPTERDDRADEKQLAWDEVAAKHERVIVLADPGMGKSWLLRVHAHRLASSARELLEEAPGVTDEAVIPILVRADVLAAAPGKTLADAVTWHLVDERLLARRSAGRMREQVNNGGVVLLIDALDEVPRRAASPNAQAPLRRLEDLLRSWTEECIGSARLILSSRLAGYIGPPVLGAREAELLPFSASDAEEAMRAWDLPAHVSARLLERMRDPALAGMSRIPLLLSLICSLAAGAGGRQPDLPQTRTGLYSAVVWQFLSGAHRSAEHGGSTPTLNQAERQGLLRSLTRVAVAFADTPLGWVDRMPHAELLDAIGGDTLAGFESAPATALDRLSTKTGVLVPAGSPAVAEQEYMFLHRAIAEYLVARYLSELPPEDRMRIIAAHMWFDPDWAEVIPLLAGLLATARPAEAQDLARHFLNQRPDPLHHAFLTSLRILGEMPDAERMLTGGLGTEIRRKIHKLIRSAGSRDILARVLTRASTWPRTVVAALIDLASDSDPAVRHTAVTTLSGQTGPDITATLITCLTDDDWKVRHHAAEALRDRAEPEVTSALLNCLTNWDYEIRDNAVSALAPRVTPQVTSALLTCLTDKNSIVRVNAIRALARRATPEVTSALLICLRDEEEWVRHTAVEALAFRDTLEVTSALATRLADESEWVRRSAARVLAQQGGPEVIRKLLAMPDPGIRRETIKGLAGRESAQAISAVLASVIDQDRSVRSAAVSALAVHGGSDVTTALFTRLRDADPEVSRSASHALARRGGPAVTKALLARLVDQDSKVRCAVVRALTGRGGPEVTKALIKCLTDQAWEVRESATAALIGLDTPDATEALLMRLTDPDRMVRFTAVRALTGRVEPDVVQALIKCLTDQAWLVRSAAARAMGGRDHPDVTRALLGCLTDEAWEVSAAAISTLATYGSPDVTRALVACLRNPGLTDFRSLLARALAGREGAGVTPALLSLCADPDENVRMVAIRALAGHHEPRIVKIMRGRLNDESANVRLAAVEVLAVAEDHQVTEALLARLTDQDTNVRQAAVRALADRKDATVLWWLCQPLKSRLHKQEQQDYVLERFRLVCVLADRVYTKVPPQDRAQIRRRLDRITVPF